MKALDKFLTGGIVALGIANIVALFTQIQTTQKLVTVDQTVQWHARLNDVLVGSIFALAMANIFGLFLLVQMRQQIVEVAQTVLGQRGNEPSKAKKHKGKVCNDITGPNDTWKAMYG